MFWSSIFIKMVYYISIILCEYLGVLAQDPNVLSQFHLFSQWIKECVGTTWSCLHLRKRRGICEEGPMIWRKSLGLSGSISQMKKVFHERHSEKMHHVLLRGLESWRFRTNHWFAKTEVTDDPDKRNFSGTREAKAWMDQLRTEGEVRMWNTENRQYFNGFCHRGEHIDIDVMAHLVRYIGSKGSF